MKTLLATLCLLPAISAAANPLTLKRIEPVSTQLYSGPAVPAFPAPPTCVSAPFYLANTYLDVGLRELYEGSTYRVAFDGDGIGWNPDSGDELGGIIAMHPGVDPNVEGVELKYSTNGGAQYSAISYFAPVLDSSGNQMQFGWCGSNELYDAWSWATSPFSINQRINVLYLRGGDDSVPVSLVAVYGFAG